MELVLPDPADHLAVFGLLVIAPKEIRDRPDERGQGLMVHRKIPFFDSHEVRLLRMLTDRGSEYCGNPERHEY
jgi:hypothetical protein